MPNTHSFAADYSEAREKFLAAAKVAGATTQRYDNPTKGPRGEARSREELLARLAVVGGEGMDAGHGGIPRYAG